MKNKSKLKKIKQNNKKSVNYPSEWLYLNTQTVTPVQIAEVFDQSAHMTAQLWKDAGVVEVEFSGEAKSMDIESAEMDFEDEYSIEFMQNHHIKSMFQVTIVPEEYEYAKKAMCMIMGSIGGFFCGDTDNFEPIIKYE